MCVRVCAGLYVDVCVYVCTRASIHAFESHPTSAYSCAGSHENFDELVGVRSRKSEKEMRERETRRRGLPSCVWGRGRCTFLTRGLLTLAKVLAVHGYVVRVYARFLPRLSLCHHEGIQYNTIR